jgi:hypothetical protein
MKIIDIVLTYRQLIRVDCPIKISWRFLSVVIRDAAIIIYFQVHEKFPLESGNELESRFDRMKLFAHDDPLPENGNYLATVQIHNADFHLIRF